MLYVVERAIPHGDGVRSEGGIGSDMISLLYNIRLWHLPNSTLRFIIDLFMYGLR